jgi:hypothetical protein
MDPIIASARGAIDGIKAGLEVGKKTEELMGDIIKFVNHSADVKYAASRKDSLRKLINNSKTVEQEAVEVFMRKKAIEEMEDDLRKHICREFGTNAWKELMDIQAEIKKERKRLQVRRQFEKWGARIIAVIGLAVACTLVTYLKH